MLVKPSTQILLTVGVPDQRHLCTTPTTALHGIGRAHPNYSHFQVKEYNQTNEVYEGGDAVTSL